MFVSKQTADLITWARALLAITLPIIGISQGAKSLQLAVILLFANWTADSVDGVLARRSRVQYRTWIGDHDLEIDMLISVGTLAYMAVADFLLWQIAAIYLLVWLFVFWRFGVPHVLGVLFQAPIYAYFIIVAIREIPQTVLWLLIWMAAAIIVSWPKFPKVIIPEFFRDVRNLINKGESESD
jgi:hypothetical protein